MSKKILIIDADQDIVEIIKFVLEDYTYKVTSSLSPDIVKEIPSIKPDLIILDDWLPVIKGRVVCKSLKSAQHTRHIPVIMLSDITDLEIIAHDCLADDYLAKPFDILDLVNKIALVLKNNKVGM